MQRELSLAGMDWPGSERRLTESSSHTNGLPNAGSSAIADIGHHPSISGQWQLCGMSACGSSEPEAAI
jgi:hypothetical protein